MEIKKMPKQTDYSKIRKEYNNSLEYDKAKQDYEDGLISYDEYQALDNVTQLGKLLVRAYGTQIVDDLPAIKCKLDAMIAAHLVAGAAGDNPLAEINKALALICK